MAASPEISPDFPLSNPAFVVMEEPLHLHPLFRLIKHYADECRLRQGEISSLQRNQIEISETEDQIWKLHSLFEKLAVGITLTFNSSYTSNNFIFFQGKCKDGYTVYLDCDYETAEFSAESLSQVTSLHADLQMSLFNQLPVRTFKAGFARFVVFNGHKDVPFHSSTLFFVLG